METLRLPKKCTDLSSNVMEYEGGVSGAILLATYRVASFVVVKGTYYKAMYDFFSNVNDFNNMVYEWRLKNGVYETEAVWVPGGNGNAYPPHSGQGATGYHMYTHRWIKN